MPDAEFKKKNAKPLQRNLPKELAQNVTGLPGISVSRSRQLKKLGINTVYELLRYFPRAYENWQNRQSILNLQATNNKEQVLLGQLVSPLRLTRKGKLTYIKSKIHDGTGSLDVVWFNQPWLEKQLRQGENYIFRGKVQSYGYKLNLMNPKVRRCQGDLLALEQQTSLEGLLHNDSLSQQTLATGSIGKLTQAAYKERQIQAALTDGALANSRELLAGTAKAETDLAFDEAGNFELTKQPQQQVDNQPIYSLTAGLALPTLQRLMRQTLDNYVKYMPEILPQWLRAKYKLADSRFAYEHIHFPGDDKMQQIAKRKLAFEELLLTQLALRTLKENKSQAHALPLQIDSAAKAKIKQFISSLPYTLTAGQKEAVKAILQDLSKATAMNRLLQGDVGSGKTLVGVICMLAVALSGGQAAFMAPTVILAEQHFSTLQKFLAPILGEEALALVTGKLTAKRKKELYVALESGAVKIVIGTNAVLSDKLPWQSLQLAITDEQHRFGVNQRLQFLADKAYCPHVLVMSATPIPRSLALVLYGDLDITIMAEKPAKRQEIMTYMATYAKLHKVYEYLTAMHAEGAQAYWICPLVEEAADSDKLMSAVQRQQILQEQFPQLSIGLVHGKLKEAEKQVIMQDFYAGKIDVLVATTVVEVGVDNPQANFMVIENAERFGLAQLHQLRGRVGRGEQQALCILLSDMAKQGSTAYERLLTLCRSQDGFFLANEDLKLRGPGDFFGTRQHGLPEFKVANLYEDKELISETQAALNDLLSADPRLQTAESQVLQAAIKWYFPDWQDTVVL